MPDVIMPRLSDSMEEGTIIRYGADAAAVLADIRADLEQPLRLAL